MASRDVINWKFFVGKRPVCVHTDAEGPARPNYYEAVDPGLLVAWVTDLPAPDNDEHGSFRGRDTIVQRSPDARVLAIRLAYLHVLEILLAHIAAGVQAPGIPEAWLTLYRVEDLRTVAGQLAASPWTASPTAQGLEYPESLAAHLFGVNRLKQPADARKRELQSLVRAITRLAQEYLSVDTHAEFNSIKHGLRAVPGGFTLKIADIDLSSPHGTRRWFTERVNNLKHHYELRHQLLGWDAVRDKRVAFLAALLFQNLAVARKKGGGPHVPIASFELDEWFHTDLSLAALTHGALMSDYSESLETHEDVRRRALEGQSEFVEDLKRSTDPAPAAT